MQYDRRDFLKSAAAATIGAPAIHLVSQTKKYRTALIGTGRWGMNILREAMAAGQSHGGFSRGRSAGCGGGSSRRSASRGAGRDGVG